MSQNPRHRFANQNRAEKVGPEASPEASAIQGTYDATKENPNLQPNPAPGAELAELRTVPTAKKPLEQQFLEHQAARPEIPHGLSSEDLAFVSWYWEFVTWAATKTRLESKLKTRGLRFDSWGRLIRTTGGEE